MSRVVDFCPSSDDELPDLKSTVKKPAQQKPQPTPGRSLSPKKELVPKSATKSVRKIRRLENNSQLKGNLLFQKAAPEEPRNRDFEGSILQGSPRKSPVKRRGREPEQSILDESIFDDSPPRTVKRTARKNRSLFVPILEDESENDSESTKIDQLLSVQTPALKRLKPLMRKTKKPSAEEEDESPETPEIKSIDSSGIASADTSHNTSQDLSHNNSLHIPQQIPEEEPQDNSQDTSQDAFDSQEAPDLTPDDQLMAESTTFHEDSTQEPAAVEQVEAVEEAHADESSTDQTMSEGSSSFSNESSGSEFMSDQSIRSEEQASSPLAPKASIPRSLQVSKIPAVDTSNALQPRGINTVATPSKEATPTEDTALDLADELSRLQLQSEFADADQENQPSTPSKSAKPKGLASTAKHTLMPKTPHRPSTDAFWNQESTNQWNETHSPKKIILPPKPKSPVKSPKKESRKAFDAVKQGVASDFLNELDAQITEGKIAELAESTGGVQLVWSKTLNTTAGRANWRRETLRTKKADGTEVKVTYKHHASIELAEKVIDDEERLLNVVAHEFCHLANFMVSGISNNPHGKEFKAWASKATKAFGNRGVKVTTKHTYEIAFKYVWECGDCGSEYKRHSRSIDPQKHRCGSCKGTLKQTKPAPRGGGKPSEYQIFVREQMKVVKEENPGIPQKDIMKVIAGKWAKRSGKQGSPAVEETPAAAAMTGVAAQVVDLTL